MVSKNRRLVSGLLSALLVSGSASAGFVGSAAGAAKSALELPLNVAGKVVGSVVGAAALAGALYLSYCEYKAILDGTVGLYGFSEVDLGEMFKSVMGKYVLGKGIYECLKNSPKVVEAVASGLATKLRQLSGVEIVGEGNLSLKVVVADYLGDARLGLNVPASTIVISAVEIKVKSDVGKKIITANYGELSKLFWRGVVRLFPESCWRHLVNVVRREMSGAADRTAAYPPQGK